MSDSRRFNLLADFISRNYPCNTTIADIAGGKGALQIALREHSFKEVRTFDKRHKRISKKLDYKFGFFDQRVKDSFDLLVGLHPDEASDVIILEASRRKIPFILVPCCTKPNLVPTKQIGNYKAWCNHLRNLAQKNSFYEVRELSLDITGPNKILQGFIRK